MRCPKCQYISFDEVERCRNCGYEFSLAAAEPPLDVEIGRDQPPPGRDTSLAALDTPLRGRGTHTPAPATPTLRRPLTAEDLPLFTERVADDQAPLVTPPAVPRAPLGVRRPPPAPPRSRSRAADGDELPLVPDPSVTTGRGRQDLAAADHDEAAGTEDASRAGIIRRLAAGLIDAAVLGAIHAAVIYLTLRLCELTLAEWRVLPLAPLTAFLLLLCGGYFILFTAAGGQTIGKMAARIRVVSAPAGGAPGGKVSFATALVRTCAALGSTAALGAGFLPVLFSADRRAFHDRVAGTAVVRA